MAEVQNAGVPFGLDLRFPGQFAQWETGLHQNWMRDYDPSTGRYIQADPLGLVDGASVYGYALQSPGRYVDPRREFLIPGAIIGGLAGGVAGYLNSGTWTGAAVGFGAGALVGATGGALGVTSVGAGMLSFFGAGAGQVAAFYVSPGTNKCSPTTLSDLVTSSTFWGANIGAGIGGGVGSFIGGRLAGWGIGRVFGPAPYFGGFLARTQTFGAAVSEGVGGAFAGIGETAGGRLGGWK